MDLEEQVEKLTKETMAFRKEMLIMKGLLKQQNNLLRDLIDINHRTIQTKQYRVLTTSTLDVTFPIATVHDLDYLEQALEDPANKDDIIAQITRIVGDKTLSKKIDQVLSINILLEFNIDGHKNKRRLLEYPNFMDALFKATMQTEYTNDNFHDELRISIKRSKNRYFKNESRKGRAGMPIIKSRAKAQKNLRSQKSSNDEDSE